jgi:hypothetical protein
MEEQRVVCCVLCSSEDNGEARGDGKVLGAPSVEDLEAIGCHLAYKPRESGGGLACHVFAGERR